MWTRNTTSTRNSDKMDKIWGSKLWVRSNVVVICLEERENFGHYLMSESVWGVYCKQHQPSKLILIKSYQLVYNSRHTILLVLLFILLFIYRRCFQSTTICHKSKKISKGIRLWISFNITSVFQFRIKTNMVTIGEI